MLKYSQMEKAHLPSPVEHESFKTHRRDLVRQILLPILLATAVIIVVAVMTGIATFREGGDAARWAAISTIWIVLPVMTAGLILLVVFIGLIYLMARLLQLIPPYTDKAQKFAWRVEGYVRQGADMAAKPILAVEELIAMFKKLFGLK